MIKIPLECACLPGGLEGRIGQIYIHLIRIVPALLRIFFIRGLKRVFHLTQDTASFTRDTDLDADDYPTASPAKMTREENGHDKKQKTVELGRGDERPHNP